jgi:hypothetical protein
MAPGDGPAMATNAAVTAMHFVMALDTKIYRRYMKMASAAYAGNRRHCCHAFRFPRSRLAESHRSPNIWIPRFLLSLQKYTLD